MGILIGFTLVLVLGILHYFGVLGVRRVQPHPDRRPHAAVVVTFAGLLALHTLEILSFAAVYRGLAAWGGLGSIGGDHDASWSSLIYFSGINFATLGYTQLTTSGSIRMINMMQALGGFMVLTWSATVMYSVSKSTWERPS